MNEELEPKITQPIRNPDDITGILLEARIKIFDPDSGETLVEGRA